MKLVVEHTRVGSDVSYIDVDAGAGEHISYDATHRSLYVYNANSKLVNVITGVITVREQKPYKAPPAATTTGNTDDTNDD